jgi:outer membrane immunogenic protein
MQKTLAAATVAALIGVAGAANAADVYSRGGSLKDGPIFAPASSWTGFYIGLGVGGGDIDSHIIGTDNAGGRANLDGLGGDGFLGRAQVGYDYQLGSRWLAGIFFDYDLANLTSSFNSTGQLTDVHANLKESWTAGGRLGYLLFPNTLTYVLAGYSEARFDLSSGFNNDTFSGYTLGSGVEFQIAGNWYAKGEYRFTQYEKQTVFSNGVVTVTDEPRENTIVSSLIYKFGGFQEPLK